MNSGWISFLPDFIRRRIEAHQVLQKVLGNTGWMMADKIIRMGLGLVVGVLLARYLGPLLFGQFSFAFALVMIFSPIAELTHDGIVIRGLVQNPERRDEILGTSFLLMAAGGLLAFIAAMVTIYLTRPDDRLIQWLVGIMAAASVFQAFNAIEFWFESHMQWRFTVYAKTSAFLLVSIIKIVLILLKAPLIAFAWAFLAETITGALGLVIVYRLRSFSLKAWRFKWQTAGSLLQDSWPLIISALLTMIYLRIDQVMLGSMAGSRELGNYSVAVQISEAWYFIPMVICSSVLPVIVESETVSDELVYAHMQRIYSLMTLLGYLVALPISFFSNGIIRILFSAAYSDAGPLLAILIWTGVLTNLGSARHILIVAKNWSRVNLMSIGLGCAMNVFLNYLLIPGYGAMGAVIATFISYWFAIHGTCFIFKPLNRTGWMMTRAMIFPKFW